MFTTQRRIFFLPLAVGLSLCLLTHLPVLEVHADEGTTDETTKNNWLVERARLLYDFQHRLGESKDPQVTLQKLKRLNDTMPAHELFDWKLDWPSKRKELIDLIELANVDKRKCSRGADIFYAFNSATRQIDYLSRSVEAFDKFVRANVAGYGLKVETFVKHFETKQIEACVPVLSDQVTTAVAHLDAYVQKDAATLMDQLPSEIKQWDRYGNLPVYDDKVLAKALYRFLETEAGCPIRAKNDKSNGEAKFNAMYDDGLSFCWELMRSMANSLDDYLAIRYYYPEDFDSRFQPDTVDWLKATKVCRMVYNNQVQRELAYREASKKSSKSPSRLSCCFSAGKQ